MAKNTRKQAKTAKQNQQKIANKWPKYHLNHQNHSPIRAPWSKPVLNSRKYASKTGKMAKNAIKQLQKWLKMAKNGQKCHKTATVMQEIGQKSTIK